MKDIRAHLEKLEVQIAECEMIRDLATDPKSASCSPDWQSTSGFWPGSCSSRWPARTKAFQGRKG